MRATDITSFSRESRFNKADRRLFSPRCPKISDVLVLRAPVFTSRFLSFSLDLSFTLFVWLKEETNSIALLMVAKKYIR